MKTIIKRNCIACGKEFNKLQNCSLRAWAENYKFCSRSCTKKGNKNRLGISYPAWNKGKKLHYKVWNKGNGEYAKKLGFGKWMLGKKQGEETRRKKSEKAKLRIQNGQHNFYVDGRTPQRVSIRHSLNYKLWRESVFKRDNFTCQECGENGCYLEAHHIKPFSIYPELRFAIDNGISLCIKCHAKVDIFRARTLTKKLT